MTRILGSRWLVLGVVLAGILCWLIVGLAGETPPATAQQQPTEDGDGRADNQEAPPPANEAPFKTSDRVTMLPDDLISVELPEFAPPMGEGVAASETLASDLSAQTVRRLTNGPLGDPSTTRVIITISSPTNGNGPTLGEFVSWNASATAGAADEGAGDEGHGDKALDITAAELAGDILEEVEVRGLPGVRVVRNNGFEDLFFAQADGSIVNVYVKGPIPPEGIVSFTEALVEEATS